MKNDMEDNQEDYLYFTHEYWCDLLSKIEVKDNTEREATDINKIASARVAYLSDSGGSLRISQKKKAIL